MSSHRLFPPGSGHVVVPTSSRAAAKAGLSLYTPSRTRGAIVRRLAWFAVGVVAPWAVPGVSVDWSPPMESETWEVLSERWMSNVGPFEQVAVHQRRQASRVGFAVLLLRAGNPVAFAKLRAADGFGSEVRALQLFESNPQNVFQVPRVLDAGTAGRWSFVLTTALKPSLHRVPRDPQLPTVTATIAEVLQGLDRAPGTPAHWTPMHGDLTPWNLRESPRGTLTLIDWEDATWGPPGADEVLYRVSAAAVRRRGYVPDPWHEDAVGFWIERLESRRARTAAAGDSDQWLLDAMLQRLHRH